MFQQSEHFVVHLVHIIEVSGTYTHSHKKHFIYLINTSFLYLLVLSPGEYYSICITVFDIFEKYDHIIYIMLFCVKSLHCPHNQPRKEGHKYSCGAFIILYALIWLISISIS